MTATILTDRGVNLPAGTLFHVTVACPPSANNLFATVKGKRVKSDGYKKWLKAVVPRFRELARPALPCRVNVTIDGEVNSQRDGDNFIKPIHDALVDADVIPGDSLRHVQGGRWDYRGKAGVPTVTVWLVPVEAL